MLMLLLLPMLLLPLHYKQQQCFDQNKYHDAAHKGRLSLVITSAEGEHSLSGEQKN